MLAVVLSLAASCCYGISDFLGGLKTKSLPLVGVLLVSQAAGLTALLVVAAVDGAGPPSHGSFWTAALLAGVFEVVGVTALYQGLAAGRMSLVAPAAAVAPMIPVIAGVVIGELPNALQFAGLLIAFAGIMVTVRAAPAEDAGSARTSLVLGGISAVGFGGFYVTLDAASEDSILWALVVSRVFTVVVVALAAAIRRRPLGVGAADVPVLVATGLLIVSADALFGFASTEGLLGVVAVLSALYPLVTIGLASVVLGERLLPLQRVGVACAFLGVAAVAASG